MTDPWVKAYAAGETCEICGAAPKKRKLHRDHDHKTGRQRGLLCFTCNRFILGKYATAAKLRAAADYLDRYDPEVPDPISYDEAIRMLRAFKSVPGLVSGSQAWRDAVKAKADRYADDA